MSNSMLDYTRGAIRFHHAALIRVTKDLTMEHFTGRPGPKAPPIGWHLWHIARWADRVQLAFPVRHGEPRRQIWEMENLAASWDLDIVELGILQAGEGMGHEAAARIPQQIGQDNIVDYAERCFALFEQGMDQLTPEDIEWVRPNTQPYTILVEEQSSATARPNGDNAGPQWTDVPTEDRRLVAAPANETPLASDLTYQLGHAARHLGMIEALRGVVELHGTASA